jgi:endonuclease-3 related protein
MGPRAAKGLTAAGRPQAARGRTATRSARASGGPRAAGLLEFYQALLRHNGPRGWWPGRTRLEIVLGAILTQNTSWKNVEQALRALRSRRLLTLRGLRGATDETLSAAIRPSGYFRQKTRKIRAFLQLLDAGYRGSLEVMARAPVEKVRRDLLGVWGIGPETADSILLYAFEHRVFVVDAYTSRVLARHGLVPQGAGYEVLQKAIAARIPENVQLYNDFHAQLVWVGQHHCRPHPICEGCPLAPLLSPAGPGAPPRDPGASSDRSRRPGSASSASSVGSRRPSPGPGVSPGRTGRPAPASGTTR